jgi:uncharacterized protein
MSKKVVIVGTGPAGLFAALELSEHSDAEIRMYEKGPDLQERTKDDLTSGLGGSGAFSDGKLTMPDPRYPKSLNVGGQLPGLIGEERYLELVEITSSVYSRFGGRAEAYENDDEKIKDIVDNGFRAGLRIIPTRVRHFGSDLSPHIIAEMIEELRKRGVLICTNSPVESIRKEGSKFLIQVAGVSGSEKADYIVAAPGRGGAEWLSFQKSSAGLEILPRGTGVDIGIRAEVPADVFGHITKYLYDPKIEFYHPRPFEDRVRTFCVCPYGEVLIERYSDLLTTVNGHSLYEKRLSDNINFAVLVSMNFTEPFTEPLKYADVISQLANMLGGKVLVQRLGDLKAGRRSTPERIAKGLVEPTLKEATPGDISLALPYRHLTDLLEMLQAIDKIAPGIAGDDTLLYGNEVKFYSSRVKTSNELEAVENFFVGGDGSGITRGLLQSSVSGMVVAQAILKRI